MLRSGHGDRKQQLVWTDTRVEEQEEIFLEEQDFRGVCIVYNLTA